MKANYFPNALKFNPGDSAYDKQLKKFISKKEIFDH